MLYDTKKQYKKIKNLELQIKITYIACIITAILGAIILDKVLGKNIIWWIIAIIIAILNGYGNAKRQNEKIDKMKYELDMYIKQMEK